MHTVSSSSSGGSEEGGDEGEEEEGTEDVTITLVDIGNSIKEGEPALLYNGGTPIIRTPEMRTLI